ncbi:MAG TPA: YggT family protein [Ktedonobacterales bacterium]|nr:YggT family protein [Ktedonobacterales bacterium]
MLPDQPTPPPPMPNLPQEYRTQEYRAQEYRPARMSSTERACQIIYLAFGVIEVLILIRILLKLLAANPDAGFSAFIYGVTEPFVTFFQGVFPVEQGHASVLELSAVLAIIVYMLLAYVIVRFVRIMARRQTPTTT